VVGGGVGAGVARAQQPGQRFAASDLGAVQKRQQRVVTPRLLPGRGRLLFVVGVIDRDGGIDIQVQPFPGRRCRPGRPGLFPGMSAGSPDTGQMLGVNPRIDEAPHRGRRRRSTEDMFTVTAALPDPVDAVRPAGDRGGQIGEHRTRRIGPRAPIRVRQCGRDLR